MDSEGDITRVPISTGAKTVHIVVLQLGDTS